MGKFSIILDGLDLVELSRLLTKMKNRYIKITLDGIDSVMSQDIPNEQKSKLIRKYVLDGFNDNTRAILRTIFDYDD